MNLLVIDHHSDEHFLKEIADWKRRYHTLVYGNPDWPPDGTYYTLIPPFDQTPYDEFTKQVMDAPQADLYVVYVDRVAVGYVEVYNKNSILSVYLEPEIRDAARVTSLCRTIEHTNLFIPLLPGIKEQLIKLFC